MGRETTIRKYNYIRIVEFTTCRENEIPPFEQERQTERGICYALVLSLLIGLHARCDDCGSAETNFNVDDNAVTGHTGTGDAKTSKHGV